jgi:hypothetical protein
MSVEVVVAQRSKQPSEVEVLRRQSMKAWDWFEATVSDVNAEQANWWPPGTANSIGATYLHVVINADVEISRLIQRREPLVERLWNGEVGQGFAYEPVHFDQWFRHVAVDWDALREYGRDVHTTFVESLEELTDEQLNMAVDMTRSGLGIWQGRDLFELHGHGHPQIHGGEIAVLKGLQDAIGWAESEDFRAAVRVTDHFDQ